MGAASAAAFGPPRVSRLLFVVLLLLVITLCCCLQELRSDALTLDPQEVAALRQIAAKLKIPSTSWNFSVEPCTWDPCSRTKQFVRNLTCGDCNATTNLCHVVNIELKGQNLTGVLPEEFGNLTSLRQIDLSRNYIDGSIPAAAWASLPLLNISLLGNRLSDPIPEAIGKITTLQSLVLENNMLQGRLPQSLGNLTSLTRLHLAANNFTGELPETLGNLKNLTEFRIDGNDISGKIPGFIGNWSELQRLDMQGTSLEGPFPSSLSMLKRIRELRVTDLKNLDGNLIDFPPIGNMPNMKHLILRNCSISGQIPDYVGRMGNLKILSSRGEVCNCLGVSFAAIPSPFEEIQEVFFPLLRDLSFNNLTGAIPRSFDNPQKELKNVYLTNNKLSGSIPSWIRTSKKNVDVSYNTFTDTTTAPSCRSGDQNFVASFSSIQNVIGMCLRKDFPCSGKAKNYEVFINCGGERVTVDTKEYEEDVSNKGPSTYFSSNSGKWAYSSTGDFVGNSDLGYIAENTSTLAMPNPELYTSARLNPLSLKYYGLCMQNGNYTVKLHFAEIIFTNDQTFVSVGRRVFDVSIQGKKLLKDFNIAEAANGTGKEIIRNFTIPVEKNTLEIHFQWAGKGTNAIPDRGFYGPLISAISVTPNFEPELDTEKFPIAGIVGIVIASCVLAMLAFIFLWFCLRRKNIDNNELRGLVLKTGCFTLKQIKAATRNFDPLNKIGEGGFGPVYKGVLPDGSAIAVKLLSSKSKQGNREFVNEIGMISALQHPNLVKLFGCCIEGNQLLLIYEYMENNSLARALFGPQDGKLKLDWPTRRKICLGVARGLAYLHEESTLKIVHRDIKATNILLDKDLNAKISDFGLAKLDEEDNTHISTRIAGTMGYMAPEYATRGYLTDKADVYSFGVVILETVSGKCNTKYRPKDDFVYLLDWAYELQEQGSLLELVDPSLGTDYSKEEAQQMLNLALVCTNPSPTLRPSMSAVVSVLGGQMPVQVPSMEHTQQVSDELGFEYSEKLSYDSQTQSTSTDVPWVDSSLSMPSSRGDTTFHSSTSQLHSDRTV